MPEIGDVCLQAEPRGIWWMRDDQPEPRLLAMYEDGRPRRALTGLCIWQETTEGHDWEPGDLCPFSVDDGADEGVTVIGRCADEDQARAIAALVGIDGFVKVDNNEANAQDLGAR